MNKEQFIYWLKGFSSAIEIQPTERQWDAIVSELEKIQDCPDYSSPIEEFKPNPMWQEPHYINPWDKHKVTCQPGDTNLTVTTGSGTSYNASSIITNGNTTWTNLPKGTNVSYTSNQLELDL